MGSIGFLPPSFAEAQKISKSGQGERRQGGNRRRKWGHRNKKRGSDTQSNERVALQARGGGGGERKRERCTNIETGDELAALTANDKINQNLQTRVDGCKDRQEEGHTSSGGKRT